MAARDGGPIYCLMSALSTKAKSIASVTLDVVRINTLGYLEGKQINRFQNFQLKMFSVKLRSGQL